MWNFAANFKTSFLTVKLTLTMFEEASAWLYDHHVSCHFTQFSGEKRKKGAIGRKDKNFSAEGKVSHCCQVQIDFISFVSIRRTGTLPLTMHSVESHLLRDGVNGTPKSSEKGFFDMWRLDSCLKKNVLKCRMTDKFTWPLI